MVDQPRHPGEVISIPKIHLQRLPSDFPNPRDRLFWLAQERTMSCTQPRDLDLNTCLLSSISHMFLGLGRDRLIKFTKQIAGWNLLPASSSGFCILGC